MSGSNQRRTRKRLRLTAGGPGGKRRTRAQGLVEIITDEIVDGILPPGTSITEHTLVRRYGTSRTPVREAIRELMAMGFAERAARRATVVANPSREVLAELVEALAVMEASCARLAAERMSDTERELLVALHRESSVALEAGDFQRYAEYNEAFHSAIYAGTANPTFAQQTNFTRRRLAPFRRAQMLQTGSAARSYSEHGAIVEAILARDPAAAYDAVIAHFRHVRLRSEAVLDAGQPVAMENRDAALQEH